jgi:hypothetical protein
MSTYNGQSADVGHHDSTLLVSTEHNTLQQLTPAGQLAPLR